MKIRKRYLALLIPVGVLCALVLTNPSRSQHFARFVDEFQKREAEHIATCPKCAGSQQSAGPDADDISSILREQGTYFQSLFILSYVSDGGLFRAKTIGIGGVVFGPALKEHLKCPKDFLIMPLPSVIKREVHITIRSDDTLLVDGQLISEAALLKRLGDLADKSATEVMLHAGGDVKHVTVIELMEQIGSLGFQVGMKTIPDGEAEPLD